MTAKFILSLDCEGKWGVADHLTPHDHDSLSDARLRAAYAGILAALDDFDIPATFAFVGTFSLSADRLKALTPAIADLARDLPGYLEPALADMATGTRQGWTGDWAVEAVATAKAGHEIGLHGATHVPWTWPGMTPDMARRELGLIYEAKAPILSRTTTFIFPRNAGDHPRLLDEFGIAGLRATRAHSSRLASLASEFNLFEKPEGVPPPARPLAIPAGYFVNWLSGGRRLAPQAVSRLRARRRLARAAATGETVHYWTHPENIASAPATLDLLRGILAEVAALRDAGRCEVLTQDGWCRRVDPAHVAASEARRDRLLGA
jgi:hypothetical protein